MEANDWLKMWETNNIRFHQNSVHPHLVKHEKNVFSVNSRIYLPLCGKTLDMNYLSEKGHDVVGCEFSEIAILDFFKEHSIAFTCKTVNSSGHEFDIYEATDIKITIYKGDFFALGSQVTGKFDGIWDRGGFVAVNPSQHGDYAKVIKDVLKPNGKYLLNSCRFPDPNWKGPPHSISQEDMENTFGSHFKITNLETLEPNKNFHNVEVSNFLLTFP
ncbi:putative thiopurine S-methyltransferase [Clavelina lepadiformis]|uniref:putative thiopurine S-methyltransferase n=1 Tax=Clavelina lepadiformis TaxID=159417 RepID=UPI00404118AF